MLKLSSTSALVLLWAGQACYQTKTALHFLSQLNLQEGRALYTRCRAIFPYAEVIKNRKFGIMYFIKQCIADAKKEQQIIIAGAGFDALGVELTTLYPHLKVFEIDRDNMAIKAAIITKSIGNTNRLSFIDADLCDADTIYQQLLAHGWDYHKPTLLVLEGISYYLSTKSIQALVDTLSPRRIVFEYLRDDCDIAPHRLHIPQYVFALIADECGLSFINKFNLSQIEQACFPLLINDVCDMQVLEKMRTGVNTFFTTKDSGWIDVCLLQAAV